MEPCLPCLNIHIQFKPRTATIWVDDDVVWALIQLTPSVPENVQGAGKMAGVNVVPITSAEVIGVLGGGSESKFDWVRKGGCDVTDGVSPWRPTVLRTPQSRCRLAARVRGQGGLSAFTTRS